MRINVRECIRNHHFIKKKRIDNSTRSFVRFLIIFYLWKDQEPNGTWILASEYLPKHPIAYTKNINIYHISNKVTLNGFEKMSTGAMAIMIVGGPRELPM